MVRRLNESLDGLTFAMDCLIGAGVLLIAAKVWLLYRLVFGGGFSTAPDH